MSDRVWIWGINAVEGALSAGTRCVELRLAGSDNPRIQELADLAAEQGVSVRWLDAAKLDELAGGARHQNAAVQIETEPALTEAQLLERVQAAGNNALVLLLDEVEDPHNLGACLRSAAAAGVTAVVAPKRRAASITPAVRKVAAGGAETVAFAQVTNLRRCLQQLQDAGLWLVGLDGEAEKTLFEMDLAGPIGLVLGGEADGLRRLTRETCDFLARIPMAGSMESLNVSVSAGIALFEALRQRSG